MTNEQRVRAYWDRLWSRGEVEYALEFYAPTYRENDEVRDAAGFVEAARTTRGKFERFEATVDRLFHIDGGIVTQVTYLGHRHVGDYQSHFVPASGKDVEMTGLDVFLFEDGRCVEHLHEADHYTMFLQLGAPPTAQSG